MNRNDWLGGLLTLGVVLVLTGGARAERTALTRTSGQRSHGTYADKAVPYTTNGRSPFGVANGVAPKVTADPIVDDPRHPQVRKVYNLPFYGAAQSFGDKSEGVSEKTGRQKIR